MDMVLSLAKICIFFYPLMVWNTRTYEHQKAIKDKKLKSNTKHAHFHIRICTIGQLPDK